MQTSAGQSKKRAGAADKSNTSVFVPGEGWVKWVDIKRQVGRAFNEWRIRRAMAGHFIFDAAESRAAEIERAKAKSKKIP